MTRTRREALRDPLKIWGALRDTNAPPAIMRNLIFGPSLDTQALKYVAEWSDSGAHGMLVLSGPVGVAKSHAAVWWLNQQVQAGRKRSLYVHAPTLAELTFDGRRDASNAMLECDALVIDELGTGLSRGAVGSGLSRGNWVLAGIEGVLTSRGLKPTVIVTNLEMAKLGELIGKSAVDRAYGFGAVHSLSGESMRGDVEQVLPFDDDIAGRPKPIVVGDRIVKTVGLGDRDHSSLASLVDRPRDQGRTVVSEVMNLFGLAWPDVRSRALAIASSGDGVWDRSERSNTGCSGNVCGACVGCFARAVEMIAESKSVSPSSRTPPARGFPPPRPRPMFDGDNVSRDRIGELVDLGFGVISNRRVNKRRVPVVMRDGSPGHMPMFNKRDLTSEAVPTHQDAWHICNLHARSLDFSETDTDNRTR